MATTEQRLATVEKMLGAQHLNKSSTELQAALTPANTIPGGRYPYILDSYQLHVSLDQAWGKVDALQAKVTALELRPAGNVIPVPTPTPVPSSSTDVVAALAALNINVARNKLAVGMPVVEDSDEGIQVGGEAGAGILGRSNTRGSDMQNAGEIHTNVMKVCDNDGGMRWIQYGRWFNGQNIRNTLNRAMTILALDSQGDLCISDDRAPKGQVFYIIKDFAAKAVRLCAFQVGWAINLRETPTNYSDPSKVVGGTPQ